MLDQVLGSIGSGVRNSHTTIIGMVVAVCTYIAQVGPALPTTHGQWLQFLASIGIAALGVLAKDARTGSQSVLPPPPPAAPPVVLP